MRYKRSLVGLCSAAVLTGALSFAPPAQSAVALSQHPALNSPVNSVVSSNHGAPTKDLRAKDKPGKGKPSTGKAGNGKPKKSKQSAASKKAAAKKAAAKRAAAKKAAAKRAAAKRAAIAYQRAKAKAKAKLKGVRAPRMVQGRICPTRHFSYGAGWGADRGRRKHEGMDMSGRRGTPLFAIEAGRIDRTKRQSNGALQIVMKGRSGSKYYYGHMQHVFVRGGQSVRAGQVIATMGDSGSRGAVHLHFEFWKSGGESAAVDPAPLLRNICKAAQ